MKKGIVKFDSKIGSQNFIQKVQEQYVEKYASDMVNILEDQKKLERSLAFVNKIVEDVQKGDYEAINRYKKARQRLEVTEDGEF